MKFLQIFALIFIAASAQAFLTSGNLKVSGSFQAHPLLANHPFLKNHRLLGGANKPDTPDAIDNTIIPETPPPPPPTVEAAPQLDTHKPSSSIHSQIDIGRLVNDLVNVKTILLRHVQKGISERLDRHVQRLDQFGKHVENHFNKNKGSGAPSSGPTINFDADLSIDDGSKFEPEPIHEIHEPVPIPAGPPPPISAGSPAPLPISSGPTKVDVGALSGGDFDVVDHSLDAYKGENLSVSSNCDHH